jgi:Amt family ammonium transporter
MTGKRIGFRLLVLFILAYLVGNLVIGAVFAQDASTPQPETTEETAAAVEETVVEEAAEEPVIDNLDTVWILVASFLVFFMQAGFALVEAGFVNAKHVTNILMKNVFDLVVGSIGYWAIGFGLMFGAGNAFFGSEWFFLNGLPEVYPGLTVPGYAFYFFQFAFAATAATIASGAMAGRTEFKGYLIYSLIVTAIIYPIVGHWIWGGGWLANLDTPFVDFAGSTVVHSVGGWVGLVGAVVLGPRRNRFGPDGVPMPGHSMTLAALGTFILWLGWFGFNPGSQLNADGAAISLITVTTNLAAAAGGLTAMLIGWYFIGKPQLPWGLNGALAGLVSITAPCAFVTPLEAVIIGAIGGAIMYIGVNTLEKLQIDDVVGAVSVHGFCGVWGTLAVGIFHAEMGLLHGGGASQLVTQAIGIVAVAAFVMVTSYVMFMIVKATVGLRAPAEAEDIGLDIYEHGLVAYPEFTNSPSEPVQMTRS